MTNNTQISRISRGGFLKVSAIAGSGLLVGLYLPACSSEQPIPETTLVPTLEPTPEPTATEVPKLVFNPDLLLKIDEDGIVTVTITRPDVGTGNRTGLAMVVAEQLGASWDKVRVEQAPAGLEYGNQLTGGSTGISDNYDHYSQVGAAARQVLIAAAAASWGEDEEECKAVNGEVIHSPSGERLSFAELVEIAVDLPIPDLTEVQLKEPRDFTLIGTSPVCIDDEDIVTGKVKYAWDLTLPGMVYACVARNPAIFGVLESYDATAALAVPGVHCVIELRNKLAVVADSTWASLQGRAALNITWDKPEINTTISSVLLCEELRESVVPSKWNELTEDPNVLTAIYEFPNQAHAMMEPPCCVVDLHEDHCEVWAPTQAPMQAQGRMRAFTKLPPEKLTIHIPLVGGSFGSRYQTGNEFITEACEIARKVNRPVKLFWTRDEEIQQDDFHPHTIAARYADLTDDFVPTTMRANAHTIPTGGWRGVTSSTDAFIRESFIDEMAASLDRDPVEFRLERYGDVFGSVINKVVEESNWGSELPPGWGRGIACHSTWNFSPCAQVAEVSVADDGSVSVHRVVCAIDCGIAIHPELVKSQMEGGIIFGLTAALKSKITITNATADQSNFHNYHLLRMEETPLIEVHIIESERERPYGVGEMSTPPVIPAVFNAVFDATGIRVRHLPLQKNDLTV
ncbi:MAG: molybdopterin-dependent oxidoreductase [Anaerolineales bacterium]|nr:molybdopterin-dependent oxidoreductase [Anaerolineales bacterium]